MSALVDAWGLIDEHLAEYDPAELVGEFDNTDLVNRMLRARARLVRTAEACRAAADAERARIDEWLERQLSGCDTSFLDMQLQSYHEARLARDPKVKTIKLPNGTLSARTQQVWSFDDETFLGWAQARRTDLVRTKVEVDKAAAKKALVVNDEGRVLDATVGEFVEGVSVATETRFSVKASTEEVDQ